MDLNKSWILKDYTELGLQFDTVIPKLKYKKKIDETHETDTEYPSL